MLRLFCLLMFLTSAAHAEDTTQDLVAMGAMPVFEPSYSEVSHTVGQLYFGCTNEGGLFFPQWVCPVRSGYTLNLARAEISTAMFTVATHVQLPPVTVRNRYGIKHTSKPTSVCEKMRTFSEDMGTVQGIELTCVINSDRVIYQTRRRFVDTEL